MRYSNTHIVKFRCIGSHGRRYWSSRATFTHCKSQYLYAESGNQFTKHQLLSSRNNNIQLLFTYHHYIGQRNSSRLHWRVHGHIGI